MNGQLEIDKLCAGYDGRDIVHEVSIEVPTGSIVCVVGPNGSGKSTLMKAVAGLLPARSGRIRLGGKDITAFDAPARARARLAYVPQERNVFRNMSVAENLLAGFEFLGGDGTRSMGSDGARSLGRERLERVHELFPELRDRAASLAGNLSGGQRQMLAFGSALMADPLVLLLDEPSAGLSPRYVDVMFEAIGRVNRAGVTLFMIEQNTRKGLGQAHIGVVLVAGQVRATMPAHELSADTDFHRLYLGGG